MLETSGASGVPQAEHFRFRFDQNPVLISVGSATKLLAMANRKKAGPPLLERNQPGDY
jgi:hypothetical protein